MPTRKQVKEASIIIILEEYTRKTKQRKFIREFQFNHKGLSTPTVLLHSRNNSSRNEDASKRNKVHWRITKTLKRGVTSRD